MDDVDLAELVARIPLGWTRVEVDGRPYGLVRRDRADGQVITVWAEALDGTQPGTSSTISANVWRTRDGLVLRPCEMPAAVVTSFLADFRICADEGAQRR